ncbi:MAG: type II toxin-antitoxin system PemK/MazF family toxin [Bifidobacteriaceae bacterium]|jgi:mRNA interferase MazF|nr:type II toxin-antitoxin system PemK/MazF family toxin [Bifidobacteriaceae bacterium]
MKRGEVWYVDLEPTKGAEANKTRPVVIVSRDANNQAVAELGLGVVTVVPMTSNTSRVYPFEVLCPQSASGPPRASKAQIPQLRAIDAARFQEVAGRLDAATMRQIDAALKLHLAIE